MIPVVQLNSVSVHFRGENVVQNVDLTFAPREIHALVGPNGAGKSTLFKSILDAVHYTGAIRKNPSSLRTGHLIEYPAFYAKLTLRDNLRLHASYLGADQHEVDELISLVGLKDRNGTLFADASLGMRQRLGIARALIGEPHLLLLDEPTNGLDPLGIRHCRELLCQIREEHGTAIVVASHRLTEVGAVADRVTFLRRGETVFEATHAGPFVLTPAENDPCAVTTTKGRYRISRHERSGGETLPPLDLEDLYVQLMEEDQF